MKRNIFSVIGLLFFLFLLIVIHLHHPLPVYDGAKILPGLKDPVDVYTDPYGVPHIIAQNEKDLFYSAGYIAARDRLFQMSMVAFAVRGELALALGNEFIGSDIYLRTWGIHSTGKKLVKAMSKDTYKIVNDFCEGINSRINEIISDPPIEFKILGIEPPEWDPIVLAGYSRMMARELSSSWKPEIVYGAIMEYFGKDKLAEVYPSYNSDKPTIAQTNIPAVKQLLNQILAQEISLNNILGHGSSSIGSNSWVVSGSRTISGKPLIANDPHLEFTQPCRWYEMHLKGGRFNVSGVCLAGIPVPIIGQNEHCAWGFTNSMVDDMDFFIETVNPEDPTQYLYEGTWKNMKLIEETIPLRDNKDTTIVIRLTHHGPVISDIHPILKESDQVVSMAWTGNWVTNEIDAFIGLCTMQNWNDFTEATKKYGVPGQNMVYADVYGNIGWRPAVYIPIRKEGSSLIPRPGNKAEYDWQGRVPFDHMPFIINPEQGYIATANNKTIDDSFPYYISGLWADPSRAERIIERLGQTDRVNINDMKSIQLDYTSRFASEIIPHFLSSRLGNETGRLKTAYDIITEWDFVENPESQGALIFHAVLRQLVLNIYGDEMALLGDNYLEAFTEMKYLHSRSLRNLLVNGTSSWIDDIRTKNKVEKLEEILRRSFSAGINEIIEHVGSNTTNWQWGRAHSLIHEHELGKIPVLNWILDLNVGPYASGGSDKSPNAGGYSFNDPYEQTAGASMRRIVDLSNLNETQFILPTGQSGLSHSHHYRDQADLYHSGDYRTTWFDETFIRNNEQLFRHLVLTPEK